jgi:hypothetical protein
VNRLELEDGPATKSAPPTVGGHTVFDPEAPGKFPASATQSAGNSPPGVTPLPTVALPSTANGPALMCPPVLDGPSLHRSAAQVANLSTGSRCEAPQVHRPISKSMPTKHMGRPRSIGSRGSAMGPMEWTSTVVDHQALPPSPSWAGRDGEGRWGSKGAEGPARGRQSNAVWSF